MRVLLIGGMGSIGRRYQAVLRNLGVHFSLWDPEFSGQQHGLFKDQNPDYALIASPTDTHADYCEILFEKKIPFLCEKPVTKDLDQAAKLEKLALAHPNLGYVVNNWAFLATNIDLHPYPKRLTYDFFHTGRDGLLWDVCQLIYLAQLSKAELSVRTGSHFWDVTWHGKDVPYQDIEQSYLQMVRAFLDGHRLMLWNLNHGIQMTRLVAALDRRAGGVELEGFDYDPSADEFNAIPRENL